MLQDLEARHTATAGAGRAPVYQGLAPATAERKRPIGPIVLSTALVVVLAAAGYYGWTAWQPHVAPVAVASLPIPPPAKQTPVAKAQPAKVAAPAPATPVAAAPAPAPPDQSAIVDVAGKNADGLIAAAAMATPPAPVPAPIVAPAEATASAPAKKTVAKLTPPASPSAAPSEAVIDKRVRPLTSEQNAENFYHQGANAVEQGRDDQATQRLLSALAADPRHTRARELLVALALKNGRQHEAGQLLEEGLVAVPDYYPFALLAARIYLERKAPSQALTLLESTAPLAATDAEYHAVLATVYQRLERHADAVAAYRRAVELQPNDARAWVGLGISLESERQADAARQAYQKARAVGALPPALRAYTEQRLAALTAR